MDDVATVVFSLGSLVVAPFWLLMLLAPRWRWTERIVGSPAIVAGAIALYGALVLPQVASLLPLLARPRLPAIAPLLGTPRGATIAWMHFLALDLFTARFILLDARARGWSGWWLRPLLLATLLFAPLGLGAYLVGRGVAGGGRVTRLIDGPRRLWRRLAAAQGPLALVTLGCLAVLLGCVGWSAVDGRLVDGVPVWLKPAKFALSIGVAAPALAWIIGQMAPGPRGRRAHRAGTLMAAVMALELVLITVQAARGVPSHFNNATPLDRAVFAIMGSAITLFWLAELVLAVWSFRTSFSSPARTWAIRLGLTGALLGGGLGFLMARPTPAQLSMLRAGQPAPRLGAHAVGVPDGGPGLPVTRWSTEGGDLRAPHFLGLHALQGLPLAAWLLERRRRGASRAGARPVIGLGVGWLGLTGVALAQALRGVPPLAPDAVTVAAAALVGLAALGLAASDRTAPRLVAGATVH